MSDEDCEGRKLDPKQERSMAIVRRHVDELEAEFDTVQIFVTKFDGVTELTEAVNMGAGNYYARYGQVREWVKNKDGLAEMQEIDDHEEFDS